MEYEIRFQSDANRDLVRLERDEPKAFQKAVKLIAELREHPRTGTGKPEPLKGTQSGQWSRRITKKHRMVYHIYETEVVVLVISAYGHYEEK